MAKEHFHICLSLQIPMITPQHVLKETLDAIKLMTKIKNIKLYLYPIKSEETSNYCVPIFNGNHNQIIPIFNISNIIRDGLDLIYQ
jgi:GTPase